MEILTVGHPPVLAVQPVDPGMEAADEAGRAAHLLGHQLPPTMLAGIVEGADLAVSGAGDNERFAAEIKFKPASRHRQVRNPAGAGPAFGPDAAPFPLHEFGR